MSKLHGAASEGTRMAPPIHIKWLKYEKSIQDLGQETMDIIEEIIWDTDNSGHDCTLERL